MFAPTPFWSLNLLAFKFFDAFFYTFKFFFQLISVFIQPFLLFFCGYETPEECTASASATTACTSTNSNSSLTSSLLTHFSSPPFHKIPHIAIATSNIIINNIFKKLSNYLISIAKFLSTFFKLYFFNSLLDNSKLILQFLLISLK